MERKNSQQSHKKDPQNSKIRTYLAVAALLSLISCVACFAFFEPTKGLISVHTLTVMLVWFFVAAVTMIFRSFVAEGGAKDAETILKSLALSLVGSFPIPAILFLLPYGGVEIGDIVAVVAISSLAYIYASMTLRTG